MRKILITGPESSGKSELTAQLGLFFGVPTTREYARSYLTALDRPYCKEDLPLILAGQMEMEDQQQRTGAPLLFCDTGPEVIYLWSQVKYGSVSPPIATALHQRSYDLRLLCYPDLPWESDPLREAPAEADRLALFHAYEQLHQQMGWCFHIVRGKREQRLWQAVTAVLNENISKYTAAPSE